MANDPHEVVLLKQLDFFHPDLVRHKAECLLLQNGDEGSFLIRNSSVPNEFTVSVKSEGAVKHFKLLWIKDVFQFGHGTYRNCKELEKHFNSQPMLAGESGKPTKLVEPYPRDVDEPSIYEAVLVHAEGGELVPAKANKQPRSVNSKDGYLTKLGAVFKTWNVRYYKLQGHELKYFKDSSVKEPLRVLDLDQCTDCQFVGDFKGKHHVFRLTFSWRTFYMFGTSDDESKEWVNIITWRLNKARQELS